MEEIIKYLSIPVEEFSISSLDDDRIAKLSLKFMHDGENLNKSSIDLSTIQNAIINSLNNTPTGIPILASFEEDGSDFREHNDDEISIGCIPPINNNIHYEKDGENGKTYAYIDGYIWRYYSKNSIDILEQSKDMSKACSIEIEILDGKKDKKKGIYIINEFKFLGITILGNKWKPGMEGSNVKLEYSLNKNEEYINKLKELNNVLNIYFNKNFNAQENQNIETELSTENFSEDINNQDNTLGINNDTSKIVIKEENLMGFDKEKFALKFGLTANQMFDELYKACMNQETYTDEYWGCEYCRYGMRDFDEQFVYVSDYKMSIMARVPYVMEGDNPNIDFSKAERVKYTYALWEGATDNMDGMENMDNMDEFVKKEKEGIKEKMSLKKEIETLKDENKKVSDKFTSLEKVIEEKNKLITEKETELFTKSEELTTKEELISNYEKDLGEFKAYKQEKVKQEVESKIKALYSEYAEFISDEDKTTFNEIVSKCEDFEKFNYEEFEAKVTKAIAPKMKAQLFALKQNNNVQDPNKIDITLMGLPVDNINKKASKSSIEQLEEYVQN